MCFDIKKAVTGAVKYGGIGAANGLGVESKENRKTSKTNTVAPTYIKARKLIIWADNLIIVNAFIDAEIIELHIAGNIIMIETSDLHTESEYSKDFSLYVGDIVDMVDMYGGAAKAAGNMISSGKELI